MAVEFENAHALRAVLNGAVRPVHPREPCLRVDPYLQV
jgi:hypothetical protein